MFSKTSVLWLSQSVRISSPKKLPYIFMISFVRRSHSSSVNSSFNSRYSTIAGLQITLCAISSPTIFCPLHSSQRCQSTCLCVFAQLRQRISRCMVTGSQIRTTACSLVAVRSQRKGTKVYTPFWFSKFGSFGAEEAASCFKPITMIWWKVANVIDAEAAVQAKLFRLWEPLRD